MSAQQVSHGLLRPFSTSLHGAWTAPLVQQHVACIFTASSSIAASLRQRSQISSASVGSTLPVLASCQPPFSFQIHKMRSYNFAADHQTHSSGCAVSAVCESSPSLSVPSYMSSIPTYAFCYLSQLGIQLFDNPLVANFILFGQMNCLIERTLQHIHPGENVIQVAHVYGRLANRLMEKIGEKGKLTLIDIAECQVDRAKQKLAQYLPNHPFSNLRVEIGDARCPPMPPPSTPPAPSSNSSSSSSSSACLSSLSRSLYDKSVCFFLLHEVPTHVKHCVVGAQLRSVSDEVIFVDYHRPNKLNPFRPLLSAVLDAWEPYAKELWEDGKEVWNYVDEEEREQWEWKKETIFGGFYQIVVARRKPKT